VDTTTSGVEQLRSMFGQSGPGVGISRLIGMQLEVLEEGQVAFSALTRAEMVNAIGVVHGGIAATLLDSALGCAVHSTLKPGEHYTTVDLHVHYTRAISVDLGKIVATGVVVHRGSRLATAEGRLVDPEGKLLAHGTTTCLVMPA
jgi:acyl-CoA thioesterase